MQFKKYHLLSVKNKTVMKLLTGAFLGFRSVWISVIGDLLNYSTGPILIYINF